MRRTHGFTLIEVLISGVLLAMLMLAAMGGVAGVLVANWTLAGVSSLVPARKASGVSTPVLHWSMMGDGGSIYFRSSVGLATRRIHRCRIHYFDSKPEFRPNDGARPICVHQKSLRRLQRTWGPRTGQPVVDRAPKRRVPWMQLSAFLEWSI